MKHKYTLFLFSLVLSFYFIEAQTLEATLVELNFHEDSHPQDFTSIQSGFYFTATDGYWGQYGRELWYSDGTASGTKMVRDILLGKNSSNPRSLTVVDNLLFFTANDGDHGVALWKSDGTESGTIMVKDISSNDSSGNNAPFNFLSFAGKLYFSATDGTNGNGLWTSDGTEDGTIMIKNINSYDLFSFNNAIFFASNDGIHGTELWTTDGTEQGTKMVKDINVNSSGLNSGNQFLIAKDVFYFYADDGVNGFELWKSDGTESGTSLVKDIRNGYYSSSAVLNGKTLNDIIIFEASDGINGTEIWTSDGTEAGTVMIKNINGSFGSSIAYNSRFIKFNNAIYFVANDSAHGDEIWRSDGTLNGTNILKDINDGDASIWIEKFHVDEVNNKLLFYTSSTNSSEKTLWVSDGTALGTFELSKIKDSNISGLIESFVSVNGVTIVSGEDDIHGNELWVTDGTIAGTSFFVDLNYSNGSYPTKFTNVDGDLFFKARGKEYGYQLFKSDGTKSGTFMIKDIHPDYDNITEDSEMESINGTLFFSAIDGVHGYELWKSDGSESGTVMVKDINPGSKSSMTDFQPLTVINDVLYFYADDGVHGFELWRSDGSESGTYMIKDIETGSKYYYNSYPRNFVLLNGKVYFIAHDSTSGPALWTTNGTELGTIKIDSPKDLELIKVVDDKLFMVGDYSLATYGRYLWVSDGTASGTSPIKSFGRGDIILMAELNKQLFFVATNPDNGRRAFYKTDGTLDGTVLLLDLFEHPTLLEGDIRIVLTCGNYVYFGIQEYLNSDKELWRTDGTVNNTKKIAGPDTPDFLYFRSLTCFNENLLFLSESFPHKISIVNDGLTVPIQLDINIINSQNLAGYNSINEIGVTNTNIYFSAHNTISGDELYITTPNFSSLEVPSFNTIDKYNSKLINVYPNPTDQIITVKSFYGTQILSIALFDITGKMVFEQQYNNFLTKIECNTHALTRGIYFLRAMLSDGNEVNTKLIIN